MRISALMQRARHCYTTSKQAKEQRLKTVRLEREENRADQNAPALFPFLSFLFFRLSLYLALEAYREMSCRVVLIATKWAVSGGSLWAPTVSVFLTGRVGVVRTIRTQGDLHTANVEVLFYLPRAPTSWISLFLFLFSFQCQFSVQIFFYRPLPELI